MKEKFVNGKNFALNSFAKSIIMDVKYKGYDLELIIEYEMEGEKVKKFMVWTSGCGGYRFATRGYDCTVKGARYRTVEEMLNIVYDWLANDEIDFSEAIYSRKLVYGI